jgi:outer membrane protein OmpA-like peptidoglycan-associated protein
MKKVIFRWIFASVACAGLSVASAQEDLFERAPWSYSVGIGQINFEGDQQVEDGEFITLRAMRNIDSRWGWEVILDLFPSIDGSSGTNPNRKRLGGNIGTDPAVSDTSGFRLGIDGNYHLRNIENLRWDPYLSLGLGYLYFDEELPSGSTSVQLYGGGGMMYHFNDAWALRLDAQTVVVGDSTEFNALYSLGVNWRPGTDLPAEYQVSGEPSNLDTDGDGLRDGYEREIGTDPLNPDTDGDGLTDGQEVLEIKTDPLNPDTDGDGLQDGAEVNTHGTDPLNPDTDEDGLSDGAEVLEHGTDPLNPDSDGDGLQDGVEVNTVKTDPLNPDSDLDKLTDGEEVNIHHSDPLNRDTDGGGVDDGHEVQIDSTDPLDPADDFIRIELKVEFDTDKAVIRNADYDELQQAIKLMESVPTSTAVVEGHADKRKTSKRDYNIRLSRRRAEAVRQYMLDNSSISPDRITAEGYGFDNPLVPNTTEENMQRNRRVELYIRRNGGLGE